MSNNNIAQQRSVPGQAVSSPLDQAKALLTESYDSAIRSPDFYGSVSVEIVFVAGKVDRIKPTKEQSVRVGR
jgi:hypothetical protein